MSIEEKYDREELLFTSTTILSGIISSGRYSHSSIKESVTAAKVLLDCIDDCAMAKEL